MQKKLFVVIVCIVIIVGIGGMHPALTSAQSSTIAELRKKIEELVSQIAHLQKQSPQSKEKPSIPPAPFSTHPVCSALTRSLSQGMRGADVESLQEFLRTEGHFSEKATGYYGPLTAQAVAKWQTAQNITSLGIFGPRSRARIIEWCATSPTDPPLETMPFEVSPSQGKAPLTVTFSTWISGFRDRSTSYFIDFGDSVSESVTDCLAPADACISPGKNTYTYKKNGVYTARLYKVVNPCANNPICKAAIHQVELARTTITVGSIPACTKEYKPVCGAKPITCITAPCNPIEETFSNRCMMNAAGATLIKEGACDIPVFDPAQNPQCKSWYDGCNTCSRSTPGEDAMCTLRACIPEAQSAPYCTGYFTTTGNKAPSISSFSGPTTLNIQTPGTWKIEASDPEDGTLTYNITWGDELLSRTEVDMLAAPSASEEQTTTFTHEYAEAGTYTITIRVRDAEGKEARSTTTVRVAQKACGEIYAPVCGRPTGCTNTCPSGLYCAMMCALPKPQTYSNSCLLEAAGATKLHTGVCTTKSDTLY